MLSTKGAAPACKRIKAWITEPLYSMLHHTPGCVLLVGRPEEHSLNNAFIKTPNKEGFANKLFLERYLTLIPSIVHRPIVDIKI